ncbi:hypothetical protein JCM10213_007248 [Rhodosporidiobolus nylandii]
MALLSPFSASNVHGLSRRDSGFTDQNGGHTALICICLAVGLTFLLVLGGGIWWWRIRKARLAGMLSF